MLFLTGEERSFEKIFIFVYLCTHIQCLSQARSVPSRRLKANCLTTCSSGERRSSWCWTRYVDLCVYECLHVYVCMTCADVYMKTFSMWERRWLYFHICQSLFICMYVSMYAYYVSICTWGRSIMRNHGIEKVSCTDARAHMHVHIHTQWDVLTRRMRCNKFACVRIYIYTLIYAYIHIHMYTGWSVQQQRGRHWRSALIRARKCWKNSRPWGMFNVWVLHVHTLAERNLVKHTHTHTRVNIHMRRSMYSIFSCVPRAKNSCKPIY